MQHQKQQHKIKNHKQNNNLRNKKKESGFTEHHMLVADWL